MSLYELFTSPGPSGFGYGSTAEQVTAGLSLAGKAMLVTGCNSGLGQETMRVLALRGARVVGTARTKEKAETACRAVSGTTVALACDLSEPASMRACIEAVKQKGLRLDALVCNAGIMAPPKLQLAHGYELQFLTNHVGHFILVTGLLDQLTNTGRVVVVSSDLHRLAPKTGITFDNLDGSKGYNPLRSYAQSKLANVLFAKELARRLTGSSKTANALHPGVIKTNLARSMNPIFSALQGAFGPVALKSVAQGAATQVYVASHPAVSHVSGEFFADCNVAAPRPDANDATLARRLWEVTETVVADLDRGSGHTSHR